MTKIVLCTICKYPTSHLLFKINIHDRIPEGIRAKDYAGPTRLPLELSECDKKSIVVFYSKREVGRAAVYLGDQTDMGMMIAINY